MEQAPFRKNASAEPPLIFLGTSHIDHEGCRHLLVALEDICPEVILLEVSRFSILFRKSFGQIYRTIFSHRIQTMRLDMSAELSNALNYLDVPHEYRAARVYSRKTGAKTVLVDVSRFSFLQLIHAHGIITRRNIETLSIINADRFALERAMARRIFMAGDDVLAEVKVRNFDPKGDNDHHRLWDYHLERREEILYRRVISCMKKYHGKRIAYVGGWEHCIDDPKLRTLYSRIDGPKERRIVFLEG